MAENDNQTEDQDDSNGLFKNFCYVDPNFWLIYYYLALYYLYLQLYIYTKDMNVISFHYSLWSHTNKQNDFLEYKENW